MRLWNWNSSLTFQQRKNSMRLIIFFMNIASSQPCSYFMVSLSQRTSNKSHKYFVWKQLIWNFWCAQSEGVQWQSRCFSIHILCVGIRVCVDCVDSSTKRQPQPFLIWFERVIVSLYQSTIREAKGFFFVVRLYFATDIYLYRTMAVASLQ